MAINPTVGAALLGGGSSLLGGVMGMFGAAQQNKYALQQMARQNEYNQQMFKMQNDAQERFWNMNNKYNSAASQRERLEHAGYNPYMATGQVASGSVSGGSANSASAAPSAGANLVSPVAAAASSVQNAGNDIVANYNNIRMANAKAASDNADAINKLSQSKLNSFELQRLQKYGLDLMKYNVDIGRYKADLYKNQAEGQEIANSIEGTYGLQFKAASLQNMINSSLNQLSQSNLNTENINLVKAKVKNTIQNTYKQFLESASIKLNYNQQKALYNDTIQMYKVQLQRQKAQLAIDQINGKQSAFNLGMDLKYKDTERNLGVQNLDYRNKNLDISYKRSKDQRIYDAVNFGFDVVGKAIDMLNPFNL